MFEIKELEFIKRILNESESQDEMTLNIVDKITSELDKIKSCKECLWKFYWDCGRQGDVEGIFKATKEEVKAAMGNNVYFGEILGKHSEVYGELEESDCELISDNPLYVTNAVESGYNPLEYIRYTCSICGETYSVDEFYDVEEKVCGYCVCEEGNEELKARLDAKNND